MIQEKATEKRRLETLIMHKEQFKGTSTYYESKCVIDAHELLAQMKCERAGGGKMGIEEFELDDFKSVVSGDEMKRLLGDRDS
jgi:hypothetical protein